MDVTITITQTDKDAAGLRIAATRSKDTAAAQRMLALVLEGATRGRMLRGSGLDGLTNRPDPGAPLRKLTAEGEVTVADWVRTGPMLEIHKVVRWRCADLRHEIARLLDVRVHERTVGKLLARLNFFRVSMRPRDPWQDIEAQEAHRKTSPIWSLQSSPHARGQKPAELWWQE